MFNRLCSVQRPVTMMAQRSFSSAPTRVAWPLPLQSSQGYKFVNPLYKRIIKSYEDETERNTKMEEVYDDIKIFEKVMGLEMTSQRLANTTSTKKQAAMAGFLFLAPDLVLEKQYFPEHHFNDDSIHFLGELVQTGNQKHLPTIAADFKMMVQKHNNEIDVTISSPKELTEEQTDKIVDFLQPLLPEDDTTSNVIEVIDPEMLGGIKVEIAEEFSVDVSAKKQIDEVFAALNF